MSLKPKTMEEHRDYLYKIIRLKLFFMHGWLAGHPGESFVDVLQKRVDIYRKIDANPGALNPSAIDWRVPAWLELEQALVRVYELNRGSVSRFEEEGFPVLRPSLDARLERDYRDRSALQAYQCGSLRYNVYSEPTKEVVFHIANAVSPKSIFDDPLYLPCCFMILMEQVEVQYQAECIQTGTWLNSHSKWLELFPQEWHDNLSAPDTNVQWHYGFWGQFITARGTFNDKLGDYFRTNGKHRYDLRSSKCTLAAMRRHLKARFFSMRAG